MWTRGAAGQGLITGLAMILVDAKFCGLCLGLLRVMLRDKASAKAIAACREGVLSKTDGTLRLGLGHPYGYELSLGRICRGIG